jgi:hypothetical protein
MRHSSKAPLTCVLFSDVLAGFSVSGSSSSLGIGAVSISQNSDEKVGDDMDVDGSDWPSSGSNYIMDNMPQT